MCIRDRLEALGDLLGGELHGLEEFFHQLLVGAGGGFHQLGTQGLDLVGDVGGNGALGLSLIHIS